MCVQEEARLAAKPGENAHMTTQENAHMTTQEKNKNQSKQKGNGKGPVQEGIKKESKCFFCKKK